MARYQHILLAVDFFEQDEVVIERAQELAAVYQAKLSVIHVVDNIPIVDTGYGGEMPFQIDFTNQLVDIAKAKLAKLAEKLAIAKDQVWLELGSAKLEIIRVAEEQSVDLIVVGSHGRHGLSLLLGSTANSILHHAKCDVLAVRLPTG
ncbi:universal stress protein [Methylovulum miyakonense]|uniref:universal stress protein n=1 Tax=Methylovulum miyakonense TaxID=645578 RepID=UPI00036B06BC|nr:universal stress protein [Methylovulum miyakonense]